MACHVGACGLRVLRVQANLEKSGVKVIVELETPTNVGDVESSDSSGGCIV